MKKFLKITSIILTLLVIITFIVNTVIANNVISSMSNVRVVKNTYKLEDFGLVGEEINVLNGDGLKINAYIVPNENSRGNVLILHGMHGMDATSLFDYAKFIYDAGFTPVIPDLRAHGKSEGDSISFGYNETKDVLAVIDYLKSNENYKDKPIILYGLSMGGSTAINVAAKSSDVDGIISISAFASYQKQVEDYMINSGAPKAYVKIFMPSINLVLQTKFKVKPIKDSPIESIKNIDNIPILFIHGDKDTQTNVEHSRILYNAYNSTNKELMIISNKDHLIEEDILDVNSEYYRTKIVEYLNNNFNK